MSRHNWTTEDENRLCVEVAEQWSIFTFYHAHKTKTHANAWDAIAGRLWLWHGIKTTGAGARKRYSECRVRFYEDMPTTLAEALMRLNSATEDVVRFLELESTEPIRDAAGYGGAMSELFGKLMASKKECQNCKWWERAYFERGGCVINEDGTGRIEEKYGRPCVESYSCDKWTKCPEDESPRYSADPDQEALLRRLAKPDEKE